MTRESAESKARRLLIEARVTVEAAGPGYVAATARGDGDVHVCGYARGRWHCTCPAYGRCSHTLALGLICAPQRRES